MERGPPRRTPPASPRRIPEPFRTARDRHPVGSRGPGPITRRSVAALPCDPDHVPCMGQRLRGTAGPVWRRDVVGESAALTGRPRSATAAELEPVRAVAVEHVRFKDFPGPLPRGVLRPPRPHGGPHPGRPDRRRPESRRMSGRRRFAVLLLDQARSHGRRTAGAASSPYRSASRNRGLGRWCSVRCGSRKPSRPRTLLNLRPATISTLYGLPLLLRAMPYALAAVGRHAEPRADQHAAALGFAPIRPPCCRRPHPAASPAAVPPADPLSAPPRPAPRKPPLRAGRA